MNYFTDQELCCPCCGSLHMQGSLMDRLNRARHDFGQPIRVSSGYRCRRHNAEVGGAEDSAHLQGYGVDIRIYSDKQRYELVQVLEINGFTRFGHGNGFLHVDCDPSKNPKRIWVY